MSQYPQDEFDLAAKERGPKGVHRRTQSTLKRLLPFLLVILLGVLLAWGIVAFLNRDHETGDVDPSPTVTEQPTDVATDEPSEPETTDEATDDGDAEPSQEPDDSEGPDDSAATLNRDTAIAVLNGGGAQGLAGRVAETVEGDGFTNVTAGNYRSALPNVSYVYYQSDDLKETAQHIADLLGIQPVEQLGAASSSIVVVLRSDFSE